MDACIGILVYWLIGYTLSYGLPNQSDGFIGFGDVGLVESEAYNAFFFQWAFAATAATIVSGSVAGRCSLIAYGIYTIALTSFVYPVIAHWIWDTHGWLSAFNDDANNGGVIDFAGSGVVHMVGGWSGLMGAIFLGPRIGKFNYNPSDVTVDVKSANNNSDNNNNNVNSSPRSISRRKSLHHQHKFGSNIPLQVLGMFILWLGWYGFNR